MPDFAADVAAIFDDGMAVDAIYYGNGGVGAPVRIIPGRPDVEMGFGDSRFVGQTLTLLIPVTAAPALASGDLFSIDGIFYRIQGAPRRDPRRLIWTAEAKEGA